jgi:anti-sigma factor RsiW
MNQEFEIKLQAWIDGELSPNESRRMSQEIAGDNEAGLLAAELRSVKDAMAGSEIALALPETREFYWSKIQRQIEREERATRPTTPIPRPAAPWIRWLSPLAGMTALACVTFLAFKPVAPVSSFDEISSTGEGMEAVTFHDQSSGMTVVWLADREQAQSQSEQLQSTQPKAVAPDSADSEVEME